MRQWNVKKLAKLFKLRDEDDLTWNEMVPYFEGESANALRKTYYRHMRSPIHKDPNDLKILVLDIETAPLLVYCWGLWNQNIGLDMVVADSSVLSWSAKWIDSNEIMYMDVRGQKNLRNDKKIVAELYKLINQADILVTQNGKSFDLKVLNARFVYYDMDPPSEYEHIDTLSIAKKYFKFTSNKLAYMTGNLCTEHKKLTHKKFPGFTLWAECLKDNKEAWEEMKLYNEVDVLSLEELYLKKFKKWDKSKVYTKAEKRKAANKK
jgi:DNA polymerase elongation subunit (family B)